MSVVDKQGLGTGLRTCRHTAAKGDPAEKLHAGTPSLEGLGQDTLCGFGDTRTKQNETRF